MAKAYPEYDYDLAAGLLEELSVLSWLEGVKNGIESLGPSLSDKDNFFARYGLKVAERVLAAGKKYMDRTGEVIEEVARKTGISFPSIPQRFIEIWLLGTRPADKWKITENTTKRFNLVVESCSAYDSLKERLEEGNDSLPCRCGCITVLEEIYRDLKLPVKVSCLKSMRQEGKCVFSSDFGG